LLARLSGGWPLPGRHAAATVLLSDLEEGGLQ
jgi:hypothetical protein